MPCTSSSHAQHRFITGCCSDSKDCCRKSTAYFTDPNICCLDIRPIYTQVNLPSGTAGQYSSCVVDFQFPSAFDNLDQLIESLGQRQFNQQCGGQCQDIRVILAQGASGLGFVGTIVFNSGCAGLFVRDSVLPSYVPGASFILAFASYACTDATTYAFSLLG